MKKIIKTKVLDGCYYIQIPSINFSILCASPADVIKHLKKRELICPLDDGYENGPDAILLSDISVQNFQFSNLCEFPIAQMLFRQHRASKPMLIGDPKQVDRQLEYLTRGYYGLLNEYELKNSGLSEEEVRSLMEMKLGFIKESEERFEKRLDVNYLIDNQKTLLNHGVELQRYGLNRFELCFEDETIDIDLNLTKEERYESPYELGFSSLKSGDFSVIHSGQGDGWSIDNPSMSSILIYKDKIYLVDVPPNILDILNALGIGLNDIEGIFHTHAHDDHFAGLTSILLVDHKLKYYSSKVVRHSVMKKLSALLSLPYEGLEHYFDYVDLSLDTWSDIEGLEVKPKLSVHPVECNTFDFRTKKDGEYISYSHLTDIASFEVIDSMIKESDDQTSGISKSFSKDIKAHYLKARTLKKIDVGGGAIHGDAKDFIEDRSEKIILGHLESNKLTQIQKSIGSNAQFASFDHLIESSCCYIKKNALRFLESFFPSLEEDKYEPLLSCEIESLNPGTLILNERRKNEYVYLLLSGTVEKVSIDEPSSSYLYAGSFMGAKSIILDEIVNHTFRSLGFVNVLKIPKETYINFIDENNLYLDLDSLIIKSKILSQFWLFNSFLSPLVENRIVNAIEYEEYDEGEMIKDMDKGLCLIIDGYIGQYLNDELVATLKPKDYFAERHLLEFKQEPYTYKALDRVEIYIIPKDVLKNIPVIHWKLFSNYQHKAL